LSSGVPAGTVTLLPIWARAARGKIEQTVKSNHARRIFILLLMTS
jgi:hypothetical protein